MGGISKNKMYGFGPNAHSSNVLMRTPTLCSTSQLDDPSGNASTIYSAVLRAMKMT
ncbi:hypothetical protein COCNU_05G004680 [Cocos nucifera]|uniref:Uncharacterized protein n=1 Tax=Cocos nucifera TaxID=13894 RepID=A0A8K0N1I1_COCNU|nr:hypothetical protein [Cocos nucifera]KAG1342239.1 hypothetical protein COCNU_05G004680 [Cocos nucifera]